MVKFESILLHVLYQKYEGLSYVNRVGLFFEVRIMSSKHYKQNLNLSLQEKLSSFETITKAKFEQIQLPNITNTTPKCDFIILIYMKNHAFHKYNKVKAN